MISCKTAEEFGRLFTEPGAVPAGEVVKIQAGVYDIGDLTQPPASVGVTFQAAPGSRPVFNGSLMITAAGTVLDGIEVVGAHRWGIRVGACNNTVVANCRVHHIVRHPRSSGIVAIDDGDNQQFIDNIVWRCGVDQCCHGFYIAGRGQKIFKQNVAFENAGWGFHVWVNNASPLGDYVFDGNVAFANYKRNWISGELPAESITLTNNLFVYPTGTRQPNNGILVRAKKAVIEGNGFWGGNPPLVVESHQEIVQQDRKLLVRQVGEDKSQYLIAFYGEPPQDLTFTRAFSKYRVVNVLDLDANILSIPWLNVPQDGEFKFECPGHDYEPEFGCYLIRLE